MSDTELYEAILRAMPDPYAYYNWRLIRDLGIIQAAYWHGTSNRAVLLEMAAKYGVALEAEAV